jgi:hypothetical protein
MDLYKKAVDRDEHPEGQAVRIHPTLPIYENREERIFCYWDREARLPWQTEEYYDSQRRICGPQPLPVYIKINGCPASPLLFQRKPMIAVWKWSYSPDLRGSIFIGVDASVRRDSTACVCIRYDETTDALLLADYKVWKPSPNQPINLEASVEFYLRRIYNQPGVYIERTPSFSDYANSSAANWKPSDNYFNPRHPSTWE